MNARVRMTTLTQKYLLMDGGGRERVMVAAAAGSGVVNGEGHA
jgi:hypothetical protein